MIPDLFVVEWQEKILVMPLEQPYRNSMEPERSNYRFPTRTECARTYIDLIRTIVMCIENTIEIGIRSDDQIFDITNAFSQTLSSIFFDLLIEEFAAREETNEFMETGVFFAEKKLTENWKTI